MIIPDVNLLIHAYNDQAPHHLPAREWWEQLLNGQTPIGLPWHDQRFHPIDDPTAAYACEFARWVSSRVGV
jgi:hypothetical protein